jgi:hypothetical protein
MFFAPPRASVVLVKARTDERGLEKQICQPAQFFQRRRQLLVTPLRRLLGLGFDVPVEARQSVLRGSQLGQRACADVLADDAALDTLRACVITSLSSPSFPAHRV